MVTIFSFMLQDRERDFNVHFSLALFPLDFFLFLFTVCLAKAEKSLLYLLLLSHFSRV